MDELAFSREFSAIPIEELVTAIRPSMLTVPTAMMVGISTPYTKSGHLWNMYNEHYGKNESRILVIQASSLVMNPSLNKKTIESQIVMDVKNQSEYNSTFREDLEAFLPGDVIDNCIVEGLKSLPYELRNVYQCFIDPASGRGKDAFALCISHFDYKKQKVIVDIAMQRKPKFKPGIVVKEFSRIIKQYKIYKIFTDRFATNFVIELFENEKIHCELSPRSSSQNFLEMQSILISGGVEILDIQELKNQFKSLELTRRPSGISFVGHPQWSDSFHDDLACSVAGSAVTTSLNPSYTSNSPEILARMPVINRTGNSIERMSPWRREELIEADKISVIIDDKGIKHYLRNEISSNDKGLK